MNISIRLLIAVLLILPLAKTHADEPYKKWDSHDVKGLYIETEDEDDADLEEYDRFFQKYRRLSRGVYEIEVDEKVTSKLWKIKRTDIYMLFRYNPYLYRHDEGVLEWNGYDGVFYKKP